MVRRRLASVLAMVFAAGAFVATSPPRWTLEASANQRLEFVEEGHFIVNVEATHAVDLRTDTTVIWTGAPTPVTLRYSWPGHTSVEDPVTMEQDASGGLMAQGTSRKKFSLCSGACTQRVVVEVSRADPGPEPITVEWSARAIMQDRGDSKPPASARLKLRATPGKKPAKEGSRAAPQRDSGAKRKSDSGAGPDAR